MRTTPTTLQACGLMFLGLGLMLGAMSPPSAGLLAVSGRLLVGFGFVVTSVGILRAVRGRPPQHF
jgi:membrane-bound ClpP family serine protease